MRDLTIDVLLPGHGEPISGRSRVRDAIVETLGVARVLAGDTNVRGNCGVQPCTTNADAHTEASAVGSRPASPRRYLP
jgi:hypothetical protein